MSKKTPNKKSGSPDKKETWKKISIAFTAPNLSKDDISAHMKKYAGVVVLWNMFERLHSCDFTKISVKGSTLTFYVNVESLKMEYGSASIVNLKKWIRAARPEEITENDTTSSFWKKMAFNGDVISHLFVKTISVET